MFDFVIITIVIMIDDIVAGLSNNVHVSEWSAVDVHNDNVFDIDIYYSVYV